VTAAAAPTPQGGTHRLVLASASPRRQVLLRDAGYQFIVQASDIDEASMSANFPPTDLPQRLAVAKAEVVSGKFPEDVVLAADTIVAFGEEILGKPRDKQDARRMLRLLEGTTHLVITGVAVFGPRQSSSLTTRVMSAVRMKHLGARQIDLYVEGGQWEGKAGGYGIQDIDPFVEKISGCRTNIVGLPMTTTKALLERVGITPSP